MRRIALISDIHANTPALDVVLADIDAAGIDERYCLGDLVGYGSDPAGVIEHIRSVGIPTTRGNYDRGVGGRLGDCGCYHATEQARARGKESYEATVSALSESDLAWLFSLPDEIRFEHAGLRVLLTHGSPRRINEYLTLDRSDRLLARLAQEAMADVVCVGHTHTPYHREVSGGAGPIHYVNAGSVGKPTGDDPRAEWMELLLGGDPRVSAIPHRAEDVRDAGR